MLGKGGKQEENWYVTIIRKVDELNVHNQRLIAIANHMASTSFLTPTAIPPIIAQISEDMRASFNALVEGVKDYFIVIDDKLKQVAELIENKLADRPGGVEKREGQLEGLVARIEQLEDSLQRTQQKQAKLISIIEEMAHRDAFEESMHKSKELTHEPLPENQHESSFRIFSKEASSIPQLYPRPYSVIDTQKSESNLVRPHSPTNFCMMQRKQHSVRSIPLPKRSLKGNKQFELENASKEHRMTYMMSVLKN